MKFLHVYLMALLMLGVYFPQVSTQNASIKVSFLTPIFAGSAAKSTLIGQPLPAENVVKKPSYGKVFKEKIILVKNLAKKVLGGNDDVIAALLAFFLGNWGAHRFYQGDKKGGFMMLGGTLLGLAFYLGGYISIIAAAAAGATTFPALAVILIAIGVILMTAISIWAFVDFIRILIKM